MWFAIKQVYKINIDQKKASQFDEQVCLVEASSAEEAFVKAQRLGLGGEEQFERHDSTRLRWEFIGTSAIIPMKNLHDGVQCYTATVELNESDDYIRYVKEKSEQLAAQLTRATA